MYDSKNLFAWFLLLMLAVILMIIGIEGSAGKVLAVIFVPSQLDVSG